MSATSPTRGPCWAAREASVDDASVGVYPIGRVLRKVMGVWPAWLAVLYARASSVQLSPSPEVRTHAWATGTTTRAEN